MATTGDVVRASSMLQPDHGELNVPTGSNPREATVIQVPPDSQADGLLEDNINEASASSQEPGENNQETSDQEIEVLSKTELLNMMWIQMGLEGVDGNNKHVLYKLALEQWEAKDKLFTTRVDKKTKQSLSVRNEIYQLIGFYSVFQGVLLTAVAQSNLLHCNNWWSAFTLSALASIVTVFGVHQKFDTIWALEKTIGTETLARKQVVNWLTQLKNLGPRFSFEEHAKDSVQKASSPGRNGKKLNKSIKAVIFVLIIFSGTFLVSIHQILCNPGYSLLPGNH